MVACRLSQIRPRNVFSILITKIQNACSWECVCSVLGMGKLGGEMQFGEDVCHAKIPSCVKCKYCSYFSICCLWDVMTMNGSKHVSNFSFVVCSYFTCTGLFNSRFIELGVKYYQHDLCNDAEHVPYTLRLGNSRLVGRTVSNYVTPLLILPGCNKRTRTFTCNGDTRSQYMTDIWIACENENYNSCGTVSCRQKLRFDQVWLSLVDTH